METLESLAEQVRQLTARVQQLEDEREIRELLARYGFNADACRDDAYVELFTDDGAVDLTTGGAGGYEGVTRWEGREALKEFISDPGAHHAPGFYGNSMHVQGNNVVCHIEGDRAVVNSYSIVLRGESPGATIISAGNNQWELEKVDGRWRFRERRRREIGDAEYTSNLSATPE